MLIEPRLVRKIATEVAVAAAGIIDDYCQDLIVDEREITGQVLGAIRDRLTTSGEQNIQWKAKILRSKSGRADEETRHGADVLGVLRVDLPNFKVRKGFLAQAKRAEPGTAFRQGEWDRLQGQCKTMLERSPSSFVLVYSKARGICLIPAVEILGSTTLEIFDHYCRPLSGFMELFLECFVGDPRLHTASIEVLDDLKVRYAIDLAVSGKPA